MGGYEEIYRIWHLHILEITQIVMLAKLTVYVQFKMSIYLSWYKPINMSQVYFGYWEVKRSIELCQGFEALRSFWLILFRAEIGDWETEVIILIKRGYR